MNILAVNSSPRKESKTSLMLDYLVKGMKQAGADVEIISLREKNIKECIGCLSCQIRTPGQCILKDDMTNELISKLRKTDLIVYATPIYCRFLNSQMKRFIDRTYPIYERYNNLRQDEPLCLRGRVMPYIAVLAVCNYPDETEFKSLSAYMNHLFGEKLIAEIYRHTVFMVKPDSPLFYRNKIDDILNSTVQAGNELIRNRKISPDTITRITQPLESLENIIEAMNLIIPKQKIKYLNLKEIPPAQRLDMLLNHICLLISGITGNSVSADSEQGFYELGMNDAICIKFHKSLEKSLICKFPVTMLFKYPTVKSLSAYLAKEIFSDLEGFEHIQYQTPFENNGEDNINREIENLSETQAEDALIKELERIL